MSIQMALKPSKSVDVRRLPGARHNRIILGGGLFPVLTEVTPGNLLAFVRKGAGHAEPLDQLGSGHIVALQSLDRGTTWNQIAVVANSELDDHNPSVGISRTGTLVVAHFAFDTSRAKPTGTFITRSKDGGRTWEKPHALSYQPLFGHSPFGRIVTLADGTMLLPIYTVWKAIGQQPVPMLPGDDAGNKSDTCCYVLRSYDEGLTWGDPARINPIANDGYGETGLLVLSNGDVLAASRNEDESDPQNTHYLGLMRSSDGGKTWSPPQQVTHSMEHPADMILLSTGDILLVFGTRHETKGVQGIISTDGGKTWDTSRRLIFADDLPHRDPDRLITWTPNGRCDCGYPSGVRMADGHVVVGYYDNLLRPQLHESGSSCAAYCVTVSEVELLKAWNSL